MDTSSIFCNKHQFNWPLKPRGRPPLVCIGARLRGIRHQGEGAGREDRGTRGRGKRIEACFISSWGHYAMPTR